MRVDVGVGIFGFAVFRQDAGHDGVDGVDDLKQGIVREVLEREVALAGVARVRLAEDGVAVARNDFARIQRLPGEVGDGLFVDFFAFLRKLGLEVLDPAEDFLVREAVEGAGQRVETGDVRQVRIAQRRADEMRGVSGRVAALVVGVDRQVKTHQFVETFVFVAQHTAEIATVVQTRVLDDLAVEISVPVHDGREFRQFREDVEHVFISDFPVFRFVDAFLVRLGELTLGLARLQAQRQLGHRMRRFG
mmetsp:Transcript_4007/g.12435  ORF Transcript_4007/g.12435 Transcript_4007/m.12435 type:complete len:248 (+) Transcript_4007:259-1002(+)